MDLMEEILQKPGWRCLLVAEVAFWGTSSFCWALDRIPRDSWLGRKILSGKIQGAQAYPSSEDMKEILRVAALNMFVVAPLFVWAMEWLIDTFLPHWIIPEDDPWVLSREIRAFVGSVVILDIWFYWSHRVLHWPWWYRHVHKMHHRYHAPCGMGSIYAHPLEFIVGNIAGVFLGPLLMKAHPYTYYAWFAFILNTTCRHHSGYAFLEARNHDLHHILFNYNYGTEVKICDYLFGTLAPPTDTSTVKKTT